MRRVRTAGAPVPDHLLAVARRAIVPTEHWEQVRLFEWASLASGRFPELAYLYAIPNAGGMKGGYQSNRGVVARNLREGVRKGYPDVGLDCARRGYHGLRIEMKRRDATPSDTKPDQRAWHDWLRSEGYHVAVCRGWEEARAVLERYLAP